MTVDHYLQCKFRVFYGKEKKIYIGELGKSFAPAFSALGLLLRVVQRGVVFIAVSFKVGRSLGLNASIMFDMG